MTLSFVPGLVVVCVALMAAGPLVAALPLDQAFADLAVGELPAPAATPAASALRAAFDALPGQVGRGTCRLLARNDEAWAARWWALGQAQRTVDTTYYILTRDVFGAAFVGNLLRHARAGRAVRLMVDSSGDLTGANGFETEGSGREYLRELVLTKRATVHVYRPVRWRVGAVLTWKKLKYALAGNHDKLLVVDGRLGVTGGRNISRDYFTEPADHAAAFRDSDVLVDDPVVARSFIDALELEYDLAGAVQAVSDVEPFTSPAGEAGWPPPPEALARHDVELLGAFALMDLWLNDEPCTPGEAEALRVDKKARQAQVRQLLQRVGQRLEQGAAPVRLSECERPRLEAWALELAGYPALRGAMRRFDPATGAHTGESKVLDQTSAVGPRPLAVGDALMALLAAARKRVVIHNPYVVLTPLALEAMERAAARGVELLLVTNSPASTDSALTQLFFVRDWPRLLARIPTLRIKVVAGQRKHHAKEAVIDDTVALVGSFNLDATSAATNGECMVATWSTALAQDVLAGIEADLKDPANDCKEYRIARDGAGKPLLRNGEPVVAYGPKDHLSAGTWALYGVGATLFAGSRDGVTALPSEAAPASVEPR